MTEYTKQELRSLDNEELRTVAKELKIKGLTRPSEELIKDILEETYPVYKLPNFRPSSVRGKIFNLFIDEKGKPREPFDLDRLVEKSSEELGLSSEETDRQVRLYFWNLIRYYGYSVKETEDGLIKLSDRRRKKFLVQEKKAEK